MFDQGKGEVVLLLHGMPDTLNVWKNQIPVLLKAGYRVVAPDLIGYGKSDKPKIWSITSLRMSRRICLL